MNIMDSLGFFESLQKAEEKKPWKTNLRLIVKILQTSEIEVPYKYPRLIKNRSYFCMVWTDPEFQYRTSVVNGGSHLEFYEQFVLPFDGSPEYLNVEILRFASWLDPGPSSGFALVGRGKIRLPSKVDVEDLQWLKLTRFKDGAVIQEGSIQLAVTLIETNAE